MVPGAFRRSQTIPFPLLQNLARDDPPGGHDPMRFPLSLRNVEYLLNERGVEISLVTVRLRWLRLGPIFAAEIRRRRVKRMRICRQWHCHPGESSVKSDGELHRTGNVLARAPAELRAQGRNHIARQV